MQTDAELKITTYLSSREFLRALFEARCREKGKYTFRQFSSDLGFGATNYLHLILKGERPVSTRAARTICDALEIKGVDKQYFLILTKQETAKTATAREELFAQLIELKNRQLSSELDKDQLEYFSEWYHPVIRELVALADFQSDPTWIAKHLIPHLTPEQIRKSLSLLERIGYIVFDKKLKKHKQTQTHIKTPAAVRGIAVVRFHQQMLELARQSIVNVPAKRRDISAVTIQVDEETAQEIKTDIQNFRKSLLAKSEQAKKPDQVFQINIQMFPFTRETES